MVGCTPPWAIVTPESSLINSSLFLERIGQRHFKKVSERDIPQYKGPGLTDKELEAPGDDARLLVVPGDVPGKLKDLGGEVLHHDGHVHGGLGTH